MAENKTSRTGASVEEYLAAVEPAGRRDDGFELKQMFDELTGAPAEMWGPSMVGYGAYAYRTGNGHSGEFFVVGFSPRKANTSLYGLQTPENEDLIAKLGPVKLGVGCIWVGRISRLNRDVLAEMVTRAWAQQSWTHPLGHVFTRLE